MHKLEDEEKKYRASVLRTRIHSLEEKRDSEIAKNGQAFNSTLVKHARYSATYELHEDNAPLAEKHILTALGHLNNSYIEALQLIDKEKRGNALRGIAEEHRKLLYLLACIKLSTSAQISLPRLQEVYSKLLQASVPKVLKEKEDIWTSILSALNSKLRKEPVDIIDDDSIIRFLEDELMDQITLDMETFHGLEWLTIRFYQALVKKDRRAALYDSRIAKRLARYREESATRLAGMKRTRGAIEDLAEGHLFNVLASETLRDWKKENEKYSAELERVLRKNVATPWVIYSYYAKAYVKGFNLAKKLSNRTLYIRKAMEYAEKGKLTYAKYILPYLYITELLGVMYEKKSLQEVIEYIDKEQPDGTLSNIPMSQDADRVKTIALYEAVIEAIKGQGATGIQTIDSVCTLREAGVISSEREVLDLLAKIILSQTGSISDGFIAPEEERSEEVIKLEGILANQEGAEIEVKLSGETLIEKILQSICAFANTNGGRLVIGMIEKVHFADKFPEKILSNYPIIAHDFVVIGFKNTDNFRQKLASKLKKRCTLHGRNIQEIYDVSLVHIENKTVLVIEVKPFFNLYRSLITLNGDVYGRYDNQTSVMSVEEVVQRMSKSQPPYMVASS